MEVKHHVNGTDFVWNDRKAANNPSKHDGVTFEQAATVFFDPLFRLVDAERLWRSRKLTHLCSLELTH